MCVKIMHWTHSLDAIVKAWLQHQPGTKHYQSDDNFNVPMHKTSYYTVAIDTEGIQNLIDLLPPQCPLILTVQPLKFRNG